MNQNIESFINRFKEDFDQYWNYGKIERAYKNDPRKIVRCDMPPNPFSGNLFAETVMVNLNAGIPSGEIESPKNLSEKGINCFEEYYDYLFNFGERRYIDEASVDAFDMKQVAFLLNYDQKTNHLGFDYVGDTNQICAHLVNLRKLLSNRCQLELIPYGSARFDTRDFNNEHTLNYFKDLLRVICSVEREVLFFNGAIFRQLFGMYNSDIQVSLTPKIGAHLLKKDGTITKRKYYYSNGILTYENKKTRIIICDSFAQQGLNGDLMKQYGELVTQGLFIQD